MIFLSITASGLAEAIALSKVQPFSIWCGSGAVTEKEYRELRGVNLTRFNYPLAGEVADVHRDWGSHCLPNIISDNLKIRGTLIVYSVSRHTPHFIRIFYEAIFIRKRIHRF
jgi:hypothetical protein